MFSTGAVKFGEHLTDEECKQLINDLSTCDLPFQCAHGRYLFISDSMAERSLVHGITGTCEADHEPDQKENSLLLLKKMTFYFLGIFFCKKGAFFLLFPYIIFFFFSSIYFF